MEPDEESFQAAARELMEEAGVRGVLTRSLGQFENQERRHRTSVFVLIVTEELDEWDDSKSIGRRRKWFQIDEALSLLVSDACGRGTRPLTLPLLLLHRLTTSLCKCNTLSY